MDGVLTPSISSFDPRHRISVTRPRSSIGASLVGAVLLVAAAGISDAQSQIQVGTFAGTGEAALADGNRQAGQLNRPHGLAADSRGNVYVSDRGNHAIRVVAANGEIRTLAGSGKQGKADGVGAAASFNQPIAVAVDRAGNVYVADRDNHVVRLIDPSGKVTTIAGTGSAGFNEGSATTAQFNQPYGVALSPDEKILYVADYLNHAIRALDLPTKQVTTLAGNGKAGFANGKGNQAQFNQPYNVKVGANGRLYVPDQNNHSIRAVEPDGNVSTIAGIAQSGMVNGRPADARFNNPTGLIVGAGRSIYVADRNNHRIRVINSLGDVGTIAGDGTEGYQDGVGAAAKFNRPIDIVVVPDGSLVVSEENNHRLRRLDLK